MGEPQGPDVVVVGAGTAGIPCAIEAAAGGLRVLLVDKADRIGGTLHLSGGHLTGAGTRRQAALGIDDHPDDHYDDVMRIGQGLANPQVLRRAVDLAPGTIDWLEDLGMPHADDSPRIVYGHEPYRTARTHYGPDEARSILAVLHPGLDQAVQSGLVDVALGARVTRLLVEAGAVVGVEVEQAGATREVRARAVVLATGGYASNPELFRELEGCELHSAAPPTSTGDGLLLAREVGAAIAGTGRFISTFGGLADPDRPGGVLWVPRVHLVAEERDPWEIYVGNDGRRFVAEDEHSIDTKERHLLEHGVDLVFHVVIDDRGVREGDPLLLGGRPGGLPAYADQHPGIVSAPSLDVLADRAGIDRDNLLATVADYNERLAAGRPDPFGRRVRPAPIEQSPFYAVRNHGATLITFAGVDIDRDFRALDEQGAAIPGLYAVGEVIGAAATMGRAFCGGMTLTPALAFGRELGRQLASSSR